MQFHLSAFFRSVDSSAGLTQIFAVGGTQDNVQSGNHVYWEDRLCLAAWVGSVLWTRSQLVVPSLRSLGPIEVWPGNQNAGGEPLAVVPIMDLRKTPIPFRANEQIQLNSQDATAGAAAQYGILVTARDMDVSLPRGPLLSIRATGSTVLIANAWTNVPLTVVDPIAAGTYAVVGLRAQSSGCIAARMAFLGQRDRPGCLGVDAVTDLPHEIFRPGGMGVWGTFTQTTIPSIEVLSISADTSETFDIAVVKIA